MCSNAPGFFVFYNTIFSMFCPLWEGETELGGLRMVRRALRLDSCVQIVRLVCARAQDHCVIMPSFESQATLPQYFLLKASVAARTRLCDCAADVCLTLAPPSCAALSQLRACRSAAAAERDGLGGVRIGHEPGCLPGHKPAGELFARSLPGANHAQEASEVMSCAATLRATRRSNALVTACGVIAPAARRRDSVTVSVQYCTIHAPVFFCQYTIYWRHIASYFVATWSSASSMFGMPWLRGVGVRMCCENARA